jgi:hypothetical protein
VEPILFFVAAIIVPPMVRVYLRYFEAHGDRHHGFEQWCEQKPLIAAFYQPGKAKRNSLKLQKLFNHSNFINEQGGFPWPFYRLQLNVFPLGDDVVGVYIVKCTRRRGMQTLKPILALLLDGFCFEQHHIDEMWLHGHLYQDDSLEETTPDTSWRGRKDDTGEISLHQYQELPFWLRPWSDKPPPTRPKSQPHAPLEPWNEGLVPVPP